MHPLCLTFNQSFRSHFLHKAAAAEKLHPPSVKLIHPPTLHWSCSSGWTLEWRHDTSRRWPERSRHRSSMRFSPSRAGTRRLGIIKQSGNGLKRVAPACLRRSQVRADDTFLSEIPPSCESSPCSCMKLSTLCVIG